MTDKETIEKAGFKCLKCSYYDPLAKSLSTLKNKVLCSICSKFAPSDNSEFEKYVDEKINWRELESFRKHSSSGNLKQGMMAKAKKGHIVSRPAFGYKIVDGKLIPAENFEEVKEIFQEFLEDNSLHQISRNHNMSVNGIKKILKNFTYVGKVKFDNEILQGKHQAIVPSELFNDVQKKFERLSE